MTDLRKAAEQALKYFEDAHGLEDTEVEIKDALRQALAQPVDAINMSQERVDEKTKGEHEWVGLDGEIPGLGLVTEEFYNGMIIAEDILKERNT